MQDITYDKIFIILLQCMVCCWLGGIVYYFTNNLELSFAVGLLKFALWMRNFDEKMERLKEILNNWY